MSVIAFVCHCSVGVVEIDSVTLLELEDVAKRYRHPSIIDIKLGFRTWYPTADQRYIDKCKAKDASTTQAALGFKICGMQVIWRAEMRLCTAMLLFAVILRCGSHTECFDCTRNVIDSLKCCEPLLVLTIPTS